MKIFQIIDGFCHWDATRKFPSLDATKGRFPADVLFVEAPDEVREGWGYKEGEFIQPTPPDGWEYDVETGTFYPAGEVVPSKLPTIDERVSTLEASSAELTEALDMILSGVTE